MTITERFEQNKLILANKSKEFGYEVNWCGDCDGEGGGVYSCCGDDITANIEETDLCPTCYEHCGDDWEECENCEGSGFVKKIM